MRLPSPVFAGGGPVSGFTAGRVVVVVGVGGMRYDVVRSLRTVRTRNVAPARRRQWVSTLPSARTAWGRQCWSYSAITIGAASSPHAGHFGSRRTLKVRNDCSSAS